MTEQEPQRKRRKRTYDDDGMTLVSPRTVRRHKNAFVKARAAELMRYAAEDEELRMLGLANMPVGHVQSERSSATEPPGFDTNPQVCDKSHGVFSSDSDVSGVVTAQYAPLRDQECGRDAELFSPNSSCATMTTLTDDVLGDDAAAAVSSDGSSDVDSDRSSALDEPAPQMESLSPVTVDSMSSSIEADFDREYGTTDKLRDYIHSGHGDAIMFTESNLKTWQVILIILGLCTRFSLNGTARRALVDAVRLFAGPRFKDWNISDHYMTKIFDPPDEVTLYHFYCEICCKELEKPVSKGKFRNHVVTCNKCSKTYTLNLDSPNYFVSIDLEYQLRSLLNLKIVNEDLSKNLTHLETDVRSDNYIRDVYDGTLYKKLLAETPSQSRLLTCVFNTDGAPLFNSSKRAFWPILLTINELSPRVRFRYPLLAGVCIVRKEPSPDLMNTYMRPFVKALLRLGTTGFQAVIGGKTIHFVLKPLLCSVDSVARPLLQNRLQFNGYFGCSWCYVKGEHKNGCMRFLMEEIEPINRTHDDYIADVRAAVKKNREARGKKKRSDVRGVRGDSVLTKLVSLDMVWAFVRDYLHADLIGVVLQLFNMFSDPNCPVRLTKAELNEVNDRLMRMTPPQEIHRLVRPLKTEKSKWKASEWRSWMLFYAIPCLTGILDPFALQHFALYVRSMYTLLQTNISETELQRVENDLYRFVIIFEVLYGSKCVTFNIHTIKHVVQCVRCCGPLWATSTFPFESTIRDLKRHVHGPRNICEQMSKKSIQRNVYRSLLEEADDSPACLAFQKTLFGRTEISSHDRTGSVVFLGATQRYGGEARELSSVTDRNEIKAFRRCISSGMVIHSAAYDKTKLKSDDTVFRTDTDKYVQVLFLIKFRNMALAEVAYYEVEQLIIRNVQSPYNNLPDIGYVTIDHFVRVVDDVGTKVIRVERLREKCVVIKVGGETYFSRLPNRIEVQ